MRVESISDEARYISAVQTNKEKVKKWISHDSRRGTVNESFVEDLTRKIQDKPEIPPVHFPSWDYLYMRDTKRLEKWVTDFLQAFDEFKTELRQKLTEAQNDPSRLNHAEILKEILGE